MITVTPANAEYAYIHQDLEEYQLLLNDLGRHSSDYTTHANTQVRKTAKAAIEAYKLDRPQSLLRPESNAHIFLSRLYRRLREVAAGR